MSTPEVLPEMWWIVRGERDAITGVTGPELIREAEKWWDRMGRGMIAEGMFRSSPANRREREDVGIMGALRWEFLTAEEQYKITFSYYRGHYLAPIFERAGLG